MTTTALAVAVSFLFMITVHEAGHLAAGLLTGVPPEEYSIGFGPRLWGFTVGGVDYSLRLLPLGGYVTFEGRGPHDSRYPLWGRMATITAGVAMNVLLAVGVFSGVAAFGEVEASAPAGSVESGDRRVAVVPTAVSGLRRGWKRTVDSASVIGRSMWALAKGRISVRRLMGPVRIVGVGARVRDAGWDRFFAFMATISVHLAVINLLPLPALDGGHLILVLCEGIRGRAFERETLATIQALGALCLIALFVAITTNDILMLIGI